MKQKINIIVILLAVVIFLCIFFANCSNGSSISTEGKEGSEKKEYSYDFDSDNDGFSDGYEFDLGYDPENAGSYPSDLDPDFNNKNFDDDPTLPNFDGSDGGTNWLDIIGKAVGGVSALKGILNISEKVDMCLLPLDQGQSSGFEQQELTGEPFIGPTGTLTFTDPGFTGIIKGMPIAGTYIAGGGYLMIKPEPFYGCVQVYGMREVRTCTLGATECAPYDPPTQTSKLPDTTMNYIWQLTLTAQDPKSGIIDSGTYTRTQNVCTICAEDSPGEWIIGI
jgi:hypothetical protein